MRLIRLVLISANALTRGGITQIIADASPSIELIGAFPDLLSAQAFLRENPIDVILVVETWPRHPNFVSEMSAVRADHLGAAVINIVQRPNTTLVQRLLDKGIRGILYINDDLECHLIQAILTVKQHGTYFSPGLNRFLESQHRLSTTPNNRDVETLKLLADGLDPKEIARDLGVCDNTIYRILKLLRGKYNAQNNTQLIAIAQQSKLFEIDSVD